ncbi:hypothetical protein ACHAWF_011050 [Thalassiosira exigua]
MASTAPAAKTASSALHAGRRLLSRSGPLMGMEASGLTSTCKLPCDAGSAALPLPAGEASCFLRQPQTRPISSMGRPAISQSNANLSFAAPTYSLLRNKVTMPFDGLKPGQPYVSPYSEFFANIEAGRTSLGTTEEMEQRASELQEQRLACGIPESELRFTTTSYGRYALPPYVAPGEHRVTVKVDLSAIPFESEQEKDVFLEIVGSRYNPEKGYLQLSSEKFASRIENKRYLVDMIERIVSSARTLAKEFAVEDGKVGANLN